MSIRIPICFSNKDFTLPYMLVSSRLRCSHVTLTHVGCQNALGSDKVVSVAGGTPDFGWQEADGADGRIDEVTRQAMDADAVILFLGTSQINSHTTDTVQTPSHYIPLPAYLPLLHVTLNEQFPPHGLLPAAYQAAEMFLRRL